MARIPGELGKTHANMSGLVRESGMYFTITLHKDPRWRLGLWVMKLGARILGARLDVEEENDDLV